MLIKIEDLTPKPLINFFPPVLIAAKSTALLFSKGETQLPSFAASLLSIDGIKSCLLTDILIGVTFDANTDKEDIKALVLAEIDDYLSTNPAPLTALYQKENIELAEAIADSFIRPTLIRDKGDIKIISYENNHLLLKFMGHCAGCPYAQNTLNNVISANFKRYLPKLDSIQIKD